VKHVFTVLILNLFALPAIAQIAPNRTEISAYSGLHRAVHFDDAPEIQRLIAQGADLEARDNHGRTAVHIAAFASNENALRLLAAAGSDMNALEDQAYDVVTIAAVANDPEMMVLALELGNRPDLITSPYIGTALIAAAHLGHVQVVRILANGGAPLDHINNLGWTALIEAVILGDGGPDHIATVEILLVAGADRDITDDAGVSPLQHALERGYGEIASLLQP